MADKSPINAPVVWIDARDTACGRRLWGMNLVERQIRQLCLRGVRSFWINVSPESAAAVSRFRPDLHRLYRFEQVIVQGLGAPDLQDRLAADGVDVLLLQGAAVYDDRVLEFLLDRKAGHCAGMDNGPVAARLSAGQASRVLAADELRAEARLLRQLHLQPTPVASLDSYVPSLRLTMTPIIEPIPAGGSLTRVDRLMYHRTFKGVIDVVARYGYYHLVRWITRQLSRTAISPNMLTVLSILAIWGAAPLLATGWHGSGVIVAWAGVLLDSIDGKLARLRLHLSDVMGKVEHVAAMPGLGLWYVATGWYLTGGGLLDGGPMARTTWILLAAFLLDKCVTGGFKALAGKELFDYRPVDAAFHWIAARRNISLVLLTLGSVTGAMGPAFTAITVWTVVTLFFHAARFAWIMAVTRLDHRLPG